MGHGERSELYIPTESSGTESRLRRDGDGGTSDCAFRIEDL
jgi:hypothetical protein